MKQNPTSSDTLTKQEFLKILKEFGTDLRTATKEDLETGLSSLHHEITSEIKAEIRASEIRKEIKMDEMELRIEDRARERHSKVLSKFDQWAGRIEKADEDQIFTTKQLNDHEKRISKLEKTQN